MNTPSDTLRHAADRAVDNPYFLAAALEAYRQERGLSAQELADYLGCPIETLPFLALCRRPADGSFQRDVTMIAARFGVGAPRLASLLREVELLETVDHEGSRIAMAARDREEDEE